MIFFLVGSAVNDERAGSLKGALSLIGHECSARSKVELREGTTSAGIVDAKKSAKDNLF